MAVADASYRFLYIDVGAYGKEHDASVFAQSAFGKALEDGPDPASSPAKLGRIAVCVCSWRGISLKATTNEALLWD